MQSAAAAYKQSKRQTDDPTPEIQYHCAARLIGTTVTIGLSVPQTLDNSVLRSKHSKIQLSDPGLSALSSACSVLCAGCVSNSLHDHAHMDSQ